MRFAKIATPYEAADQAHNLLACDPGLTTGLAGWVPNWGIQVIEVASDEWIEAPPELWAYGRLAVEKFSVHGPRTSASAEGLRAAGMIEGVLTSFAAGNQEGLEVRRPRPTERYKKMGRAKELLSGTGLAGSQHATDALAHLLVQLETWKP